MKRNGSTQNGKGAAARFTLWGKIIVEQQLLRNLGAGEGGEEGTVIEPRPEKEEEAPTCGQMRSLW